ncbi:HK97 family phage prohead protease [Paenibacillus caseinilyticus]|uniref:Peptidase U35 n=1 Tax=Paenibacillus mucilaginosus K02 TaxID=997761 RepID=I0BIR1_9BACL|nr:HK97 family phage prohead protease [Paenibacillus mucilaginosus]AFH62258.1 peptidase U35 [Paenibacillus mucilaginosus K02]
MNQKPTLTSDPNQNEVRTLRLTKLETRALGDEASTGTKITGYAAVYEEFTELRDWWGDRFYERIAKGAFDDTLADGHDIFALKNHDWNLILGRSGANLTLESHENGLYFELLPNNSSLGQDMKEDVRSGLIKGCSFGFRIVDQEWEQRDDDWFRTIKKVELQEITLTPIPAYSSTTAEVRSLNLQSRHGTALEVPDSQRFSVPKGLSEEQIRALKRKNEALLLDIETTLRYGRA